MVARERLSLDEPAADRTCFLSHVGAQAKLVPGPWIGHRDLLYAMALANLSPVQRTSLARAVLLEHGREFGVGRLQLVASSSGLPLGGSNLRMQHRQGGPVCLYTWALGSAPTVVEHEWMLLRAQPEWALDRAPRPLSAAGLQTLVALGGEVVVLVSSAVGALQIAQLCGSKVTLAAHPRFAPYLEGLQPEAPVLLWPHDALDGAGLRRHEIVAVVTVGAPESVRISVEQWAKRRKDAGERDVEVVPAAGPGRLDREGLAAYWRSCGRPKILLRGDSVWATAGAQWLNELGAAVEVQGRATQLSLI